MLAAEGDNQGDNQFDTPLYAAPPTDALSADTPGPMIATPQPDPPAAPDIGYKQPEAAPDVGYKQPDPFAAPDVSFNSLLQRLDSNPAAALQKKPGFTTGDTTKSSSTTPDSTTLDTTHSFSTSQQPPGPGF